MSETYTIRPLEWEGHTPKLDSDGEEQCTDCLADTIKDNKADTGE